MTNITYNKVPEGDNYVVMFSAPAWCVPCKRLTPVFERGAVENTNHGAKFYYVDIDKMPDYATEQEIQSVPTLRHVRGGEIEEITERRPAPLVEKLKSI